MAESACKLSEKESLQCPIEENDQQSSPLGVRRKLKTFCRRRKGSKDTIKKRKSAWLFKFGNKNRECSAAFEMTDNSTGCDSCICTVYRRTDFTSNTDSDNSNDSLSTNDMNSTNFVPAEAHNQSDTEKSGMDSDADTSVEESGSNIQPDDVDGKIEETKDIAEDVLNVSKAESSCLTTRPTEFLDDTLSAYHRCDRNSSSEAIQATSSTTKTEDFANAASSSSASQIEESASNNVQAVGAYGTDFPIIDLTKFNPDDYPMEDWDERARIQRAKEMEEGVEPPPGYKPKPTNQSQELQISELALYLQNQLMLNNSGNTRSNPDTVKLSKDVLAVLHELTLASMFQTSVHTQVDYIHCLVPDLLEITNCSCYWGKMDRYEAEKLLENKPEGTFLLRDSAQEEFLFSVSFQRYGKTLHARIEQWNHKFSFDSHDPGVFSSSTVIGLIEHYKDPSCCMYFDPMLTIPLHRTFPFSLQHLCRSVICNNISYDGINGLQLPKSLKSCLKEYHYKQRVKVRRFDY